MKRHLVTAIVLISLAACGSTDPGNGPPAAKVASSADLGVVSQDDNLMGRDGGYSGRHNGQLIWVFGDTATWQGNSDGQRWFTNTSSASDDFNASDGIDPLRLVRDADGQETELLPFTVPEMQFNERHRMGPDCESPCGARFALWPGAMVADPDRRRSLLFYQKLHAQPGEFNFYSLGNSIAIWPDDAPRPIRSQIDSTQDYPTLLFPDPTHQPGAGAMIEQDWLYTFSCYTDGGDLPCVLMRAALDQVMLPGAWQYFAGDERWVAQRSQARDLFHGSWMMSVSFNAYLNRYLVVHGSPIGGPITLRTAKALTGPWSERVLIINPIKGQDSTGWVYDGLMHPELSRHGGREIYLTYTRSVSGLIREMRLVRAHLEPITENCGSVSRSGPPCAPSLANASL